MAINPLRLFSFLFKSTLLFTRFRHCFCFPSSCSLSYTSSSYVKPFSCSIYASPITVRYAKCAPIVSPALLFPLSSLSSFLSPSLSLSFLNSIIRRTFTTDGCGLPLLLKCYFISFFRGLCRYFDPIYSTVVFFMAPTFSPWLLLLRRMENSWQGDSLELCVRKLALPSLLHRSLPLTQFLCFILARR